MSDANVIGLRAHLDLSEWQKNVNAYLKGTQSLTGQADQLGKSLATNFNSSTAGVGEKLKQIGDNAAGSTGGMNQFASGLRGLAAEIGMMWGLGEVLGMVKNFGVESFQAAQESAAASAQLAAVLKSTGGAAGLTQRQLEDLAGSMQGITLYSDEAVMGAESLLLTFKNVGASVFTPATQAILDMSTAMGQDLKSSAIQVGKALNDPVEGITALTRVGVTFSEEQKSTIESMVEMGNVAGAQKIILAELNSEFGGSAAAAREAAGGTADLTIAYGDFQEAMGGLMLTLGDAGITGALTGFLEELTRGAEAISGAIQDAQALNTALGNISFSVSATAEDFKMLGDAILQWFGAPAQAFGSFTSALSEGQGFIASYQKGWEELLNPIGQAATAVINMTTDQQAMGAAMAAAQQQQATQQQQAATAAGNLAMNMANLPGVASESAGGMTEVAAAAAQLAPTFGQGEASSMALTKSLSETQAKLEEMFSSAPGKLKELSAEFVKFGNTIKDGKWPEIGKAIVQGLAQGITRNQHLVLEKLKVLARDAIQSAKDELGVKSPSVVFAQIGQQITAGLVQGVDTGSAAFRNSIDKLLGVDRSLASVNGIAGAARDDVEKYFDKQQIDLAKGKVALQQLGEVFRANSREILSSTNRLKTFKAAAEKMGRLGEGLTGGGDQGKIIEQSFSKFLSAYDKYAKIFQEKMQEAFINEGKKAVSIGGSMIDLARQGATQLNTEVDSLVELLNSGNSEIKWNDQILSAAEATDLLNTKMDEQRRIQSDLAELSQKQNQLGYLQKQLDLLTTVKSAGLDVKSIFGGLGFGTNMSVSGLVEATNRAVSAMIGQASTDLGFNRITNNLTGGAQVVTGGNMAARQPASAGAGWSGNLNINFAGGIANRQEADYFAERVERIIAAAL